jgi:hypothetical protein
VGGRVASILVAAALLAAPEPAVAQGARAYVLDQEARTVTLLDLAGGQPVKTAMLQGSPSRLLRTTDGARVVVLDQGEGRDAGDAGFQAKTRSAATILDGRTLPFGAASNWAGASAARRCSRRPAIGCR